MRTTGEIIRNFRKSNNITLATLSETLGVSQVFTTYLEKNERRPSEKVLEILKHIMPTQDYREILRFEKSKSISEYLKKELAEIGDENSKNYIPFFPDIKASAGNGFYNFCEVEAPDLLEAPEWFSANKNVAIKLTGDSMYPELQDEDIVIIDCEDTSPSQRGIYIIKYKDDIYAKELLVENNVVVELKSKNHFYKNIQVKSDEIKIIGKVKGLYREY